VYEDETATLRHGSSRKCLAINQSKDKLLMEECSQDNQRQRWKFQNFDPSKQS
jgi:polypeptide N-acetylgalactosaminyltransferase